MGNDLPNEEEAVDQVKLLPQGDFLQVHRKLMVRYIKENASNETNISKEYTKHALFLMISVTIFLKRFAGPQDHRCC